eukprot:gene15198-21273_t
MGTASDLTSEILSPKSTSAKSIIGGRIIPSISPLTEKSKLKPSDNVDAIAADLASTGLSVGWDNGSIQINNTPLPSLSHKTHAAAINAFLNPKLSSSQAFSRPRTQSSITFSKASACFRNSPSTLRLKSAYSEPMASFRDDSSTERLKSAYSEPMVALNLPCTSRLTPLKPNRYQQMSHTIDSLHHLKAASPAGLAQANMKALSNSNMVSFSRIGVPPLSPINMSEEGEKGSSRTPRLVDMNAAEAVETASVASSHCSTAVSGVSSFRARRVHPMANFKPSRGHSFIVFGDIDKSKNGKITRSQLESAALSIGLSEAQAHKLFEKIDWLSKGYITVNDWGKPEVTKGYITVNDWGKPEVTKIDWRSKGYIAITNWGKPEVAKVGRGFIFISFHSTFSLSISLSKAQAHKLFENIDWLTKGYITVNDWGKPEVTKIDWRSKGYIAINDWGKPEVAKVGRGFIFISFHSTFSLSISLSKAQAHKLFENIDWLTKGYITVNDWGKPEVTKIDWRSKGYIAINDWGKPEVAKIDWRSKGYIAINDWGKPEVAKVGRGFIFISFHSTFSLSTGLHEAQAHKLFEKID